jgi:hypothetical protein
MEVVDQNITQLNNIKMLLNKNSLEQSSSSTLEGSWNL